jgi:uncharacterized membrane protein YidH (DUF202 family)
MSKRKQVLINKKFQLRTAFAILGIKIVVVSILVCIIGVYALYQSKKISNIVEIEDNIVQVLSLPVVMPTPSSEDETEEEAAQKAENLQKMTLQMAQNHDNNMKQLRRMITINQMLIWGIVAVIFIQGIILFFVLIRQTHRIAGPLYVMTVYMKSIIDGKIPEHIRPLRDRDLLKDFYSVFQDMVQAIKEKYTPN